MLVALEGSSPTIFGENNYKYYVWDAYRTSRQNARHYIEGPAAISWGASGVNIRKMANEATGYIRAHSGPVFLVGWSRGAAACVQVALDLYRANFDRNIEALFLFDAVDQDGSTSDFLNYIPGNVDNAYHAIATKKDGADKYLFPTCARLASARVNHKEKPFNTTHGGIAGAGNDDAGSKMWMWRKLRRHGVVS